MRNEVVRASVSLLVGLLLLSMLGWIVHKSGPGLVQVAPLALGAGLADDALRTEEPLIRLQVTRSGETPTLNLPMTEPIDARRYERAVLLVEEPHPEYRFAFAWVLANEPGAPRVVLMDRVDDTRHELDLVDRPDWVGTVRGAAFVLGGPAGPPITVSHARLSPVSADMITLYRDLLIDWMTFEGWSGHSVNFIRGWRPGGPVSPVLAVALWVLLSIGVYAIWSAAGRHGLASGSLVFIFMIGWLSLDLRWQTDLSRQMAITWDQYSGKTWEEKRLSAEDGELFALVRAAKDYFGDESRRVFVVAERDYSYPALRAKYHLLPHNADHQLPRLEYLRAGDYLLSLGTGDDRLQLNRIRVQDPRGAGVVDEGSRPFTADELDGSGSELVRDLDAPGGYARVQQGSTGDLITLRTADALAPGYYNLRFLLASSESPGQALIRVGAYGGASNRPEQWFMHRVNVSPDGYITVDLGVVLPEASHLAVRVTGASPGLRSAGFEIGTLEWRREPMLASSGNLRRVVEPVLQSRAGTLYRVR